MTNAKFEDLEKRVKKIKLKKYIKVFLFLLVLVSSSGYFVAQNLTTNNLLKKPLHVNKPVKEKKVQQYEPIKEVRKKEEKIEVDDTEPKYNTIKLNLNVPAISREENKTKVVEKKIILENEVPKKKKLNMQVKEVKSVDALLKRFEAAGDFEAANSLASLYFENKKYDRSIYWSKKASKLDAKESSSWIIYAKSKYALGNKEEAIKALELYLDYFTSDEIKKLLNFYRSNK